MVVLLEIHPTKDLYLLLHLATTAQWSKLINNYDPQIAAP
jgi:hypothetical protein